MLCSQPVSAAQSIRTAVISSTLNPCTPSKNCPRCARAAGFSPRCPRSRTLLLLQPFSHAQRRPQLNEALDAERTEALVAQFQKEFSQRGAEIAQQAKNVAEANPTERMAIDMSRPNADLSLYVRDAVGTAQEHGLDFVEFVNHDGVLISSAQFPARVGYKNDWVTSVKDWNNTAPFLKKEELPDGVAISLSVVRTNNTVADKSLYIIGGHRLDKNFLASLVLPSGMRALIYTNLDPAFVPTSLLGEKIDADQADRFAPLVEQLQKQPQPLVRTIEWTRDPAEAESFHAIPLAGRNNELLGVFFVGSSQRELVLLKRQILKIAAAVTGAALFIGLLVSFWISARITKPVEELAEGAREVAAGRWDTRIDLRGRDEIGQLAKAFNEMTQTLAAQKERLVQTERVAAWRELARRLAHELRNPLFPMQITVENLQKARQLDAKQFLEVFHESTATLRAELQRSRQTHHHAGTVPDRASTGHRRGSRFAPPRFSEFGPQCAGRHARRWNAHPEDCGTRRPRSNRGGRHGKGLGARRMLAVVHAVLHDEVARHGAGAGHRAVRRQRPSRRHFGD